MTISQIIIFIILFIIDFWLTIIRPLGKRAEETDGLGIVMGSIKMIFLWAIVISVTIGLNREREESAGKCPEFEKIENVYKLK